MKTDIYGRDFDPVTIRTSTIHSRIEGGRCIEGCMACGGKEDLDHCVGCGNTAHAMIGGTGPICREYPNCSNWRSMTNVDYDQFLEWVDTNTLERWQLGQERYQSDVKGFQGDPIDHAIEETFDSLLYLWIAKRRQYQGGL